MKKTLKWASILGTIALLGAGSFAVFKGDPTNISTTKVTTEPGGSSFETTVTTDGVGEILVQVELPKTPRYEEGAPVVVTVPTYFTPENTGYHPLEGLTDAGSISITLMYPGRSNGNGKSSAGTDDFGGPDSIKALRDVLLFALGEKTNTLGLTLDQLSDIQPLYSDVGIYAFSHPGLAATAVLGSYPTELQNIAYFVGRENPTLDLTSTLELGHWESSTKGKKIAVPNLLYHYPEDYTDSAISIDYSTIDYDLADKTPFFDSNKNGKLDDGEFALGTQVPKMFGKRYYSRALLHALEDNGVLTEKDWPGDLATPQEADSTWPSRESTAYFDAINTSVHVMLVFATQDHVQVVQDKPHIHQAYDGFAQNKNWIRLNPDLSYVTALAQDEKVKYTEHDANTEPANWADLKEWAYANSNGFSGGIPLAGVLEMMDRTHTQNWSDDLSTSLE